MARWAESAYRALMEGREGEGVVEVAFVGRKEMEGMNRRYREAKGPTDVLTFPLGEGVEGEILIWAGANGRDEDPDPWALDRIIHALLHLDGCHHATADEARENSLRHASLSAAAKAGAP